MLNIRIQYPRNLSTGSLLAPTCILNVHAGNNYPLLNLGIQHEGLHTGDTRKWRLRAPMRGTIVLMILHMML